MCEQIREIRPKKLLSYYYDNHKYKKGVIIDWDGDQLNIFITLDSFNPSKEHTRLIMRDDNAINDSPIKNPKEYMNYIEKYGIFSTNF